MQLNGVGEYAQPPKQWNRKTGPGATRPAIKKTAAVTNGPRRRCTHGVWKNPNTQTVRVLTCCGFQHRKGIGVHDLEPCPDTRPEKDFVVFDRVRCLVEYSYFQSDAVSEKGVLQIAETDERSACRAAGRHSVACSVEQGADRKLSYLTQLRQKIGIRAKITLFCSLLKC